MGRKVPSARVKRSVCATLTIWTQKFVSTLSRRWLARMRQPPPELHTKLSPRQTVLEAAFGTHVTVRCFTMTSKRARMVTNAPTVINACATSRKAWGHYFELFCLAVGDSYLVTPNWSYVL